MGGYVIRRFPKKPSTPTDVILGPDPGIRTEKPRTLLCVLMHQTSQLHGSQARCRGTMSVVLSWEARVSGVQVPLAAPSRRPTAITFHASAVSDQREILTFRAGFAFIALHAGHGALFAFVGGVGSGNFALLDTCAGVFFVITFEGDSGF